MKKVTVIAITILVLIPVALFCKFEFSDAGRKARRVRRNAYLIKPGISTWQMAELIDRPDEREPYSLHDTSILIYYWGRGMYSDLRVFIKNDTVIMVNHDH